MHNFRAEQDLDWSDERWYNKIKHGDEVLKTMEKIQASVEIQRKERDKAKESQDFFEAQLDISKDVLPQHSIAERVRVDLFDQQWHRNEDFAKSDKMKPTPLDAFNETYPSGVQKPQSAALKPTMSSDTHKNGYRGNDGVPQGRIGSLMIDITGKKVDWIGDHYLPKQTQDNKDTFTPPKIQLSSGSESQKRCNDSLSINIGSLIETAINQKNSMNSVIDMTSAIASTKELKVLNKPFKTPNSKCAFAVYTKNDKNEVVRVDFNACQASDPNNLGPTWKPAFWASKVDAVAAEKAKEQSLSDFWNYYSEKVTNPKKDLDWDGKTFYRQSELLKSMPELVNSKPSYEDEIVLNKTANTASSAPANPERVKEEKTHH